MSLRTLGFDPIMVLEPLVDETLLTVWICQEISYKIFWMNYLPLLLMSCQLRKYPWFGYFIVLQYQALAEALYLWHSPSACQNSGQEVDEYGIPEV